MYSDGACDKSFPLIDCFLSLGKKKRIEKINPIKETIVQKDAKEIRKNNLFFFISTKYIKTYHKANIENKSPS